MLAEQNQTGFPMVKPYGGLDLVFCMVPFQGGFPDLGGPRTMIVCTISGLACHKTHTGEPLGQVHLTHLSRTERQGRARLHQLPPREGPALCPSRPLPPLLRGLEPLSVAVCTCFPSHRLSVTPGTQSVLSKPLLNERMRGLNRGLPNPLDSRAQPLGLCTGYQLFRLGQLSSPARVSPPAKWAVTVSTSQGGPEV